MQEEVIIDDVTPDDIPKLTKEEIDSKLQELRKFEESLMEGLQGNNPVIEALAFDSQKDLLQQWASTLEQRFYLGDYKEPINTISAYIRRQIGRTNLELRKKENLYVQLSRNLDSKYKDPDKAATLQNVTKNTSDLVPETDFMRSSLTKFENYHLRLAKIAKTLNEHLENPKIHEDFTKVIEWREIAVFISSLVNLTMMEKELGILDQIEDEQNIRENATILQKATLHLLGADHSYRKMAHKFGVSPRQNQRIRTRLDDWPVKDAAKVIQNVQSSYQCIKCGFDPVTQRTYDDAKMTNKEAWLKIQYADKFFPIPDQYKKAGYNPIKIAEKIWAKKLKLEIPNEKEIKSI